ncbi:MAG: NUDIX domain-containing protein [Bacteroidota bacterium]
MPAYQFCPICATPLTFGQKEGNGYQYCPACSFIHYNNPVPVVAAIVEHEGEIILARNKAWPSDWFGLITGFLEKDETPEDAIIREVEEELNLTGRIAEMVGVYTYFKLNQVYIAYHVVAEGTILLNEELAEYKRVLPADLQPWPFGTGPALKDWMERRRAGQ